MCVEGMSGAGYESRRGEVCIRVGVRKGQGQTVEHKECVVLKTS